MRYFFTAAIVIALQAAAISGASARVFTSANGFQVEAEVLYATDKEVRLLTKDDRLVTVNVEQLSEADRTYLREKMGSEPAPARAVTPPPAPAPVTAPVTAVPQPAVLPPGAIKVTWTKDRLGKKLKPTDADILTSAIHEDWVCHFQVTNSSRVAVDGLKLHYQIYCKKKSSKDERLTRIIKGDVNVPRLEGFRNARVDSEKMVMSASAYEDIRIDSEGRRYRTGRNFLFVEEIEGVVITLSLNGTTVHEYVSPGVRNEHE